MKKVFKIETKNNAVMGHQEYNVFAEDIKEAIVKVENILEKGHHIYRAELLVTVEEDEDLEEYKEGE